MTSFDRNVSCSTLLHSHWLAKAQPAGDLRGSILSRNPTFASTFGKGKSKLCKNRKTFTYVLLYWCTEYDDDNVSFTAWACALNWEYDAEFQKHHADSRDNLAMHFAQCTFSGSCRKLVHIVHRERSLIPCFITAEHVSCTKILGSYDRATAKNNLISLKQSCKVNFLQCFRHSLLVE